MGSWHYPAVTAASTPGKFAVISSQMGSSTRSGTSAPIYRASKAAATNLARSLALELAPDGVAVGAWTAPAAAGATAAGVRFFVDLEMHTEGGTDNYL